MTDLSTFSEDELQRELDRRHNQRIDEIIEERIIVQKFVAANKEAFIHFFRVGGCTYPEDAVNAIANDINYRPEAQALRVDLPEKRL